MHTFSRRNENYQIVVGVISIVLFLFLIPFFFSQLVLHVFGQSKINGTTLFISRLFYLAGLAFVCWYSTQVEKQNIFIWEERRYNLKTYVVSIIVIFIILFIVLGFVNVLYTQLHFNRASQKLSELANILRQNKFLLVFSALTAGITEEIIFRGYVQPRIQIIFRSPFLGIFLSSLVFGLLHYGYGTAVNMITPFFIGLVFACYYWKYRNIKVLIICHSLWDLVAFYSLIKHYH
jgi:membrane protease YdiL (CAAX protease family)